MTCLSMALEAVDVGQVRREVLDRAGFVCRDERLSVVGVGHGADRVVVYLRNGLVVERRAVPECELALVVTGEQAACIGCPLRCQ